MNSKMFFSVLAVALTASQLLAVQSETDATAPSPWENVSLVSNDTLRAQVHASLFKQLPGETSDIVWDKQGRLKEVVIYKDEVLVRPNSPEKIELKKLPVDQLMLFDYLLIKGESLETVSELKLDYKNGKRKTKPLKRSSSEIWLKLPSAKLRNNKLKNPVLEITTEVECEISKISLVSKQGLFKEYVRQKKVWDEFPEDFFAEELFRTTVLDQNYESLSESLSENSEYFLAVLVPSRMTAGTDMANLAGVVADRRVSKMHELLSQLDAPIAAALAESDYASQFDEYTSKHRDSDIVPIRHRHALESKLFLCSEFCEASKVLQLVEQWSAWHKEASQGRNFQFRAQAGPHGDRTSIDWINNCLN